VPMRQQSFVLPTPTVPMVLASRLTISAMPVPVTARTALLTQRTS
jgi:hypothetical protein